MIKSFNIGEMEAFLLEKEAKRRGISQSELINKLIQNNLEDMQQLQKLEKVENVLNKILELYKNLNKKQDLVLKLLTYMLDKKELIKKAKENKDYIVLDFLLEGE
jgi:adenylosuccinate synthase